MLPLMEMVCYLSKLPKKVYNRFKQPLMETVCYRLWKWYVTAYGNLSKLPKKVCNRFRQPLMEMVCNHFRQPKQVTQESTQPL